MCFQLASSAHTKPSRKETRYNANGEHIIMFFFLTWRGELTNYEGSSNSKLLTGINDNPEK